MARKGTCRSVLYNNDWFRNNSLIYVQYAPGKETKTQEHSNKVFKREDLFLKIEKLSHYGIKNIEIGYTFPNTERGLFSGLNTRIYFTGLNLLTFSKFDLWDTGMGGNGLGYPPQKVYNIGLQVNF